MRVLVVDDNAANRKVLTCLLNIVGVEPDLAEDGEEAVRAWRRGRYDLILMDLQMPKLDGLGASAAIREDERRRRFRRTPIIVVTANAEAYTRDQFRAAGLDAVLPKPMDVQELFRVIGAIADERTSACEPRSFARPELSHHRLR